MIRKIYIGSKVSSPVRILKDKASDVPEVYTEKRRLRGHAWVHCFRESPISVPSCLSDPATDGVRRR